MPWEIRFYLMTDEAKDYESSDVFVRLTDAMDVIEKIYGEKDMVWDGDLKYIYKSEDDSADLIVAAVEQEVESIDEPQQIEMFDEDIGLPEYLHRFSKFNDSELWLLKRCLSTSVGASQYAHQRRLLHEIDWAQKLVNENIPSD